MPPVVFPVANQSPNKRRKLCQTCTKSSLDESSNNSSLEQPRGTSRGKRAEKAVCQETWSAAVNTAASTCGHYSVVVMRTRSGSHSAKHANSTATSAKGRSDFPLSTGSSENVRSRTVTKSSKSVPSCASITRSSTLSNAKGSRFGPPNLPRTKRKYNPLKPASKSSPTGRESR